MSSSSTSSPLGPTLETERLILRPPTMEDFEPYAECMVDEQVMHFIGGIQIRPVAWRSFAAMVGSWALQGHGFFSVLEKGSGKWLGRLGPIQPDGWPGTEIGYALVKEAWGKGYAIEGVTAAMDWAFNVLGWADIIHTINPDNKSSQSVAQRLGSTLRGPGSLPAPYQHLPIEIWGRLERGGTGVKAIHNCDTFVVTLIIIVSNIILL